MADIKISQLPATTTLTNTDIIPVVQSGANKKVIFSDLVGSIPPIDNSRLATMADNTVKANKSGSAASPSDIALGDIVETGSSVLTITGGSKVAVGHVGVQVTKATAAASGYLDKDDFTSFANRVVPDSNVVYVSLTATGPQSFTSVAAAVASISTATSTNPWLVRVAPGLYNEPQIVMQPYVAVVGLGNRNSVILRTSNNSQNFIIGAPTSTLGNLAVEGPTNSGFAAIDYTGTGHSPMFIDKVIIRKGYYGLNVHPATYGTIHSHELVNEYVGSKITQFIRVTNGNFTSMLNSFMSGPPGSVDYGFYVTGPNTTATFDTCAFRGDGNIDAFFVDNDATIRLLGCAISEATNGIHVGSSGSGLTTVRAFATLISDTGVINKHIIADTSACRIYFSGESSNEKIDVPEGGEFTLSINDPAIDTGGVGRGYYQLGEFYLGPDLDDMLPVTTYLQSTKATGVHAGGGVQRVSGLQIKVLAGMGFIDDAFSVLKHREWVDTTISLTDNTSDVWIGVDGADGVVKSRNSAPDEQHFLLLAVATTYSGDVALLASRSPLMTQSFVRDQLYAREVLGPISVNGGAVSKHTTPSRQLDVDQGAYYLDNIRRTFPSSSIATWCDCHHAPTSGWVHVMSQNTISTTVYDGGEGVGPLALPGTKYRRDLIYVTANESGADYHLVMGQTYFDTLTEAAVNPATNPSPPPGLFGNAMPLAAICVLSGATDIAQIVSQLPKVGGTASSSTGVTRHGDLSGLSADDHTQYQLRSEKNAINGYAGLDASGFVSSTSLNLSSTASGDSSAANAVVGTSVQPAHKDHSHKILVGSPVAIGTANSDGTSTSLARNDHVHAHGVQTDATLHAVASGSVNGFMASTDKAKLDTVTAINKVYDGQKDTKTSNAPTNGQTVTWDYNAGGSKYLDLSSITTGNSVTIAVSNIPTSSFVANFLAIVKTGASIGTITMFSGATLPTLHASKERWLTFATQDGGTTWRIFDAGEF